jgi:hypothetical protein
VILIARWWWLASGCGVVCDVCLVILNWWNCRWLEESTVAIRSGTAWLGLLWFKSESELQVSSTTRNGQRWRNWWGKLAVR